MTHQLVNIRFKVQPDDLNSWNGRIPIVNRVVRNRQTRWRGPKLTVDVIQGLQSLRCEDKAGMVAPMGQIGEKNNIPLPRPKSLRFKIESGFLQGLSRHAPGTNNFTVNGFGFDIISLHQEIFG